MRVPRTLRWILLVAGVCAVALTAGLVWLFIAATQVPEFYAEALRTPMVDAREQGEKFERAVLELHNEVRNEDHFRVVFTPEEINGWLISELPRKFPKALPGKVHDPRIALEPDRILAAFRYEERGVSTVITLALEIKLTESADVVAVRVRQLKAGAIPVPLAPLIEDITKHAHRQGLAILWQQEEGDPVALVPLRFSEAVLRDKTLLLQEIAISADGITVGGELQSMKKPSENLPEP